MKLTFIHPPLEDPTIPYHSTAYLKGHLAHCGFQDVSTRDLNVEFVNYCLEEPVARELRAEVSKRLRALTGRDALDFAKQEEFYSLWSSEAFTIEAVRSAVNALRSKPSFLDWPAYLASIRKIRQYFRMIGALCYPAEISDFRLKNRGRYSIYHLDDLLNVDLCRQICYPFEKYFFDRCAGDPDLLGSDCIGMSIVYDHQMLPALYLSRLMKERWPDKLFLIGGTSASQYYKYLKNKALLARFFDCCDGIVVGEGETAICEIANAGGDLSGAGRIPNLITYNRRSDSLHLPAQIHYENVATLGSPVYDYKWDLYWSPERGINYSPTRGCYWNRCTFCDYGLNTDKPTSPWRERPIPRVIEDLKTIAAQQKVRYVYFAVDVMAPGYLERLSDAMADANLDMKWGAELRLEKIFSKERCRKMAQSGCVSISFGMESGNQRVLDLIDKGTKIAYMGDTMRNFAEAGIAVQLMGFSHFPTETPAERKETVQFIQLHKDSWSVGGIGKFVLTGTALVAKNPEKFGLKLVEPKGADVVRSLGYELKNDSKRRMLSAEDGDESFENGAGFFPARMGRPWAGGTDAFHSMIYYDIYGRNAFKDIPQASRRSHAASLKEGEIQIDGRLAESALEIDPIMESRAKLGKCIAELYDAAIEPTYTDFLDWQATLPKLDRGAKTCWIVQEGPPVRCVRIAPFVHAVLSRIAAGAASLPDELGKLSPALRGRLVEHLTWLESRGYLTLGHIAAEEKPAGEKHEAALACHA